MKTEIVYSLDGLLYYISDKVQRSNHWMELEKHTDDIPEKIKGSTFNGAVEITKTKTGEKYWRKIYPFMFYEIKAGKREEIDEDDDLFKDYASMEQWAERGSSRYKGVINHKIGHHENEIVRLNKEIDYHKDQLEKLKREG